MTDPVVIPKWLALIGAGLVIWVVLSKLLAPGVRWFLRRRTNQLIGEANDRLAMQIPTFSLTKRRVLIDRLTYDPQVMQAAVEESQREDIPMDVVIGTVEKYAKEITPAFNALMYFRVGSWLSRKIVSLLYRVRLGYVDEKRIFDIDPNSSVVLVINHRSNMDYILVTYLALRRVALSYAVGEWARVFPIQQFIRATGAYFVRRGSGNTLYRRVLERYVQMAVEGGVPQAMFPEGSLSRDGLLRKPKIGLLDYMLRSFDPDGPRDLVFVPVAINYDRTLEDRTLLLDTDPGTERKTGSAALRTALKFMVSQFKLALRGKWYRFGYACANFGAPVSMRSYLDTHQWTPKAMGKIERSEKVTEFAEHLMERIGAVVPVLPVCTISYVLRKHGNNPLTFLEQEFHSITRQLQDRGAHVYIPRDDLDYAFEVGLRMLELRNLVTVSSEDKTVVIVGNEENVVAYYANSIVHLLE